MHISYDRPTSIVWSIDSTNHNAAFVTSSAYLSDGKVAIPTRMTYDVGAQTTANYVVVSATSFGSGISVPVNGIFVAAILMPKTSTAVPVGALVVVQVTDTLSVVHAANGRVVALNNGANALIVLMPNTAFGAVAYTPAQADFYFMNDKGGGLTWATSGQAFDVGEIWFGTLQEFKTATDPKIIPLGGPTERRSHSNQPQPLMRKPYRQLQANLVPMTEAAAFTDTNNFESVRNTLSTIKSALVIPRLNERGTTTVDQTAVNQQTIFGRPAVSAFGPLAGVKDSGGLWTASLTFEEAPP